MMKEVRTANRSTRPPFSRPALQNGALKYLDFSALYGRWVVLCCLPRLNLVEATIVSCQAEKLTPDGADFLAVALEDRALHRLWLSRLGMLQVPILVDPLLWLHRSYGVVLGQASTRCRTFFIDPDGLLRFHLVHDLNGRGLSAVTKSCACFNTKGRRLWRRSKKEGRKSA